MVSGNNDIQSEKDASAILYSKVQGGEPIAYGLVFRWSFLSLVQLSHRKFQNRKEALRRVMADPSLRPCLVESFKLHAEDQSPGWVVADRDGRVLSREAVLKDFLKVGDITGQMFHDEKTYEIQHIIPAARERAHISDLKPYDFTWVATVPGKRPSCLLQRYRSWYSETTTSKVQ